MLHKLHANDASMIDQGKAHMILQLFTLFLIKEEKVSHMYLCFHVI
jgi:hypothetical protein